jgi:alpha-L-fucosidase 2
MWLYYRYTMDEEFLRDVAYPFIKGAMGVYEAMLEGEDGGLALPVGVSPEFGGAGATAWGRNASFQLAVIHFLCRALTAASERLGIDEHDRETWRDIDRRLPLGSTSPDGGQLYLWEGQPLTESHRHHSHLAGIYPFDIFDIDYNDDQRRLVTDSIVHLTRQGMGQWSGWCVPWAAILHARLGNGDMADLLLTLFRRVFMGPGLATLHDAAFPGFTLLAGRPDIMQIEAGMGAAAAVLEMLCHVRGGVLRVFPAVPGAWEDVSFGGLRAEGAFLVAAHRRHGETTVVTVESLAGQPLKLANPWGAEQVRVMDGQGTVRTVSGRLLTFETAPKEKLDIRRHKAWERDAIS